jgi:hypothetical protein
VNRRRRLTKLDVELMLATYDDDPIEALSRALSLRVGREGLGLDQLLVEAGLSEARTAMLMAREQRALDELLAELNERRTLPP